MKVFLSFASPDRIVAESIQLALLGAGHEVFFDEASLPAGSDFNSRIRTAIAQCDVYIFLISPNSAGAGRYVHTELKFVKAKWPKPWGHVLPVMITSTDYDKINPYLAAVTILEPRGNVAAEVAAAMANMTADVDADPVVQPGATDFVDEESGPKTIEYYCYISAAKVDQLLGDFEQDSNSPAAHVGYSNSGSDNRATPTISYGRPDVFQRDAQRKRKYALRLDRLLRTVAPSVRLFRWEQKSDAHSLYRCSQQFRVVDVDEHNLMAKIVAEQDASSLVLHCSLSNFSHTTIYKGKPCFQSTNYGFFRDRNPMFFDTVFLLTSVDEQIFFGSPLYLKLPIKSDISL
jgi:hypothetical protein